MISDHSPKSPAFEPIFVARQPVFDRDQNIFAYELLYRHSSAAQTAVVSDADTATSKVIADGFAMALEAMQQPTRLLVNFPESLILSEAPLALPKELCVVEILETVRPLPEVVNACKDLKEAGYKLALDDFVGQEGVDALLQLADVIKVDTLGMDRARIVKISQSLRRFDAALLAEKVEDEETFKLTRTLGFSYFQGYYFSRPETMEGRKPSTGVVAKAKLLRRLIDPDYQVADISDIIAQDMGLSYRLLKYLNSAAFYFRKQVTSIAQAVTLLGQRQLRQWLMAVVLSDMASTPLTEEIAYQSLQRARFLEMAAEHMPHPPLSQDSMFLLGLFSRLDALLGMSMDEISAELPLDQKLVAALLGIDNPPRKALTLVEGIEAGDWSNAAEALDCFDLPTQTAAKLYFDASAWTKTILQLGAA